MIDGMDAVKGLTPQQPGPIVESDSGVNSELAQIIGDKTEGDAQAAAFQLGMQSMLESLGELAPDMESFLKDVMSDLRDLPDVSSGPGKAGESGPEWDHPIYDSNQPGSYENPIYDGSPGVYEPLSE